jgi:hypothetical protein
MVFGYTALEASTLTITPPMRFVVHPETLIYIHIHICHTALENLSDPIGYLLDFTNPYYTTLAGNMKARAKKDN